MTNLVANPGFEVDASGWAPYGSTSVIRDTTQHHSGVASGRAIVNGLNQGFQYSFANLPPGEYAVSLWANSSISLRLYLIRGGDTTTSGTVPMSGSWKQITAPNLIVGTAGTATLYFEGMGGFDFVYIDDVTVEAVSVNVTPADSAHAVTTDSPGLTTASAAVTPADSFHAHTADSPGLSSGSTVSISPADTAHEVTTDSPAFGGIQIIPADTYATHQTGRPAVTPNIPPPPPVDDRLLPITHVKLEADDGTGTWPVQLGKVGNINIVRGDAEPGVIVAEIADASVDPVTSTALRTNKPVRVRVSDGHGGWVTIATGAVDQPSTDYDPRPGSKTPVKVKFNALDAIRALQSRPETRGVGTINELRRLLTGSGIPFRINGSSATDSSDPVVIATNENASLWDQILVTRDSVLGYAWVDRDNVFTAYDAVSMPSSSVLTLDPSIYSDIDLDFAVEQIINTVTVNWRRYDIGTEESADVPYGPFTDDSSVLAWGNRTAEFTTQGAVEIEADIVDFAQEVLARNATAEVRPQAMTIPIRTPDDLYYARTVDINSRVTVVYPDGVTSKVMRVATIEHSIVAQKDDQRPLSYFLKLTFALPSGVSMPSQTPGTGNTPGDVTDDPNLPDFETLQEQVENALNAANQAADFAQSKSTVYRQASKPTGGLYALGDVWFDIDDGNKIYLYVGAPTNDFVEATSSYLATPNGRLLVTPAGLIGYDASNNITFFLNAATGAITMAGSVSAAADISGATVTGGTVQTSSLVQRGIKLNSSFLIAYDGSGNPTLSINASTGAVTMLGELLAGSTITGSEVRTSASGARINLRPGSGNGVIELYRQNGETPAKIEVHAGTVFSSRPGVVIRSGAETTYPSQAAIYLHREIGSAGKGNVSIDCGRTDVIGNLYASGEIGSDTKVWSGGDIEAVSGTLRAAILKQVTDVTTGSAANCFITTDGFFRRSTSSRRRKKNEKRLRVPVADLLALEPKTAQSRIKSDSPDPFPTFIAEDADELGLGLWVDYDEQGRPDAFNYPGWTVALQAIARDQAAAIEAQAAQIATLERQVKGLLELLNDGSVADG